MRKLNRTETELKHPAIVRDRARKDKCNNIRGDVVMAGNTCSLRKGWSEVAEDAALYPIDHDSVDYLISTDSAVGRTYLNAARKVTFPHRIISALRRCTVGQERHAVSDDPDLRKFTHCRGNSLSIEVHVWKSATQDKTSQRPPSAHTKQT